MAVAGGYSAKKTYYAGGTTLSHDLVISPPENFQISLNGVTGWNILIVENGIYIQGRSVYSSLNGAVMSAHDFATGGWSVAVDRLDIGAYYGGHTQHFTGNYGAVIAWKGVAFTQDDMDAAREYLMHKYGL